MGDIESAQRENVLIIGPLAFHQADLESLFFEKAFLNRGKNRRFASQPDIADADFVGAKGARGIFLAAG